MCGIAGFIDVSGRRPEGGAWRVAAAMAECLRHRGPDDAGTWADEAAGVAFGFRRLAVLDLSEAGRQPMISRDGRLVLMLNGEIYNHAALRSQLTRDEAGGWSGHSDTETLLACCAAWGIERTLERVVGMFALALWDRRARRLYLARDRFGEKPLYYGWTHKAFVFGSELTALRRYPGFDNPIDPDVLGLYMQFGHVPAPYAIYRHIYKVQPGCLLSLAPEDAAAPPPHAPLAPAQRGSLRLQRYWSLAEVAARGLAAPPVGEREAVDRPHAAVIDAVRLQSIADVPLGAFLSGGIDSSLIVALMQAQSGRPVKTFTIGFDEPAFNEAPYAEAVARHLGTDHTELYLSAQQARDVIPQLPQIYAEPLADASQIPAYLVSRLARRHVTVALSGDGGDELFGGYPQHYWWPRVWRRLQRLPKPLRARLGSLVQHVPAAAWDRLARALPATRRMAQPGDKAHRFGEYARRADSVAELYRALLGAWPPDVRVVCGAAPLETVLDQAGAWQPHAEPAHRIMLWDGLTRLPDEMLHKVDRAAMAVGLETRAPFLDHRVAELAWTLPLDLKVRGGTGKWILRRLLDRHVPRPLVERPKAGFDVPIEAWLRGPLRDWAEELLNESTLRAQGYLDPAAIRQIWLEHLAGRRNWRKRLWTVLMFQAWLSQRAIAPGMSG